MKQQRISMEGSPPINNELLSEVSPEVMNELKGLLTQKAADLFAVCDQEDKGRAK